MCHTVTRVSITHMIFCNEIEGRLIGFRVFDFNFEEKRESKKVHRLWIVYCGSTMLFFLLHTLSFCVHYATASGVRTPPITTENWNLIQNLDRIPSEASSIKINLNTNGNVESSSLIEVGEECDGNDCFDHFFEKAQQCYIETGKKLEECSSISNIFLEGWNIMKTDSLRNAVYYFFINIAHKILDWMLTKMPTLIQSGYQKFRGSFKTLMDGQAIVLEKRNLWSILWDEAKTKLAEKVELMCEMIPSIGIGVIASVNIPLPAICASFISSKV